MSHLQNILNLISTNLSNSGIAEITRGIEKESLRVTPNGDLSSKPHPEILGSALMHPHITTDYSESMVEFITEPSADLESTLKRLEDLHTFSCQNMPTEQLWGMSMPCTLNNENDISAAHYGSSNIGKLKSIYRLGLGQRYGRTLVIAGVHYNFSMSDNFWHFLHEHYQSSLPLKAFKTECYLHLIRNFLRRFWLLLYLFGASPSVCKSFLQNQQHCLRDFNDNTLYSPYATSLRMSNLGFKSKAQNTLLMTYNCINSYIHTLCNAITQPYNDYREKGIKNIDGSYRQLNDKLLQTENEFYSVIRPKCTPLKGENGLSAIAKRGIEYIEVRCMDVNPYVPTGINEQQIRFLDIFLLHCLLDHSPPINKKEYVIIQKNQQNVAYHGRAPHLNLTDGSQRRSISSWSHDLFAEMYPLAKLLDKAATNNNIDNTSCTSYEYCLKAENKKIIDSSLTPSAKMLQDMEIQNLDFTEFAVQISARQKQYFCQKTFDRNIEYQSMSQHSLNRQQQIENEKGLNFDEYLKRHYQQYTQLKHYQIETNY